MALRDQPYLPLYIQDFLTDEKLIECSAQSTGVYIRLMCIMHKSNEYGKVLLQQKDQQNQEQIKNFALKLVRQMPYSIEVIESSLRELINESVIFIEGDELCQKRMIADNSLSLIRSNAAKTRVIKDDFAPAKQEANVFAKDAANTENEIENEIEDRNTIPPTLESVRRYCEMRSKNVDPNKWHDFYTSKGWKVGTAKMKDWQAAVRTWEAKAEKETQDNRGYAL